MIESSVWTEGLKIYLVCCLGMDDTEKSILGCKYSLGNALKHYPNRLMITNKGNPINSLGENYLSLVILWQISVN